MNDVIRHVVVVGGGTAGWLTAAVLAATHGPESGVRVTVVESPDVPTIGVGEGTWPSMRDTLRRIGVSESDFFRECDASFKQGSRFDGWATGDADDRYFHPFMLPHGHGDAPLVDAWLARHADAPFASVASVQPALCLRNRAPKQAATPEFAAVANYAYHLDAGRFATFLRVHCTGRLGVAFVPDHVVGIVPADDGDIAALDLRAGGRLDGDLFVDCTGMQALLLGGHYGVGYRSCRDVLFNDRALAIQVPYADADAEIASQTTSTAQAAGWIWDIGLPTRRGVGYVHSGAHVEPERAERDLRAYLAATGAADPEGPIRMIRFDPGHREEFWHRNCVAVGLSAGFVEPLEASAIALVELSAIRIAEDLPATRDDMAAAARRFNETFSVRWERIIEFLKLHYVLSKRKDSAYWRDAVRDETVPSRLRELLRTWRHRPPSRHDFDRIEEIFPSASFQYVLYGMGFRPDGTRPAATAALDRADAYFGETARLTGRMLPALPGNRELVSHIRRHGLPRI